VPAAYWSGAPVWSPDGRQLAYSVAADSPPNIVVRGDAGTAERRLTTSSAIHFATGWAAGGRTLLFQAFSNDTGWDLFTVPMDGGVPQRLLQTPANEVDVRVSPDGRTMVYTSDESGQSEVYMRRYPDVDAPHAVSSGGGARAMWRRDGRELFFVTPDGRVMSSAMGAGATPGPPTVLFQAPIFNGLFAPAPDGRRFLIARPAASSDVVPMELVLNPLTAR
jgi:Tol biopolymer transport system component